MAGPNLKTPSNSQSTSEKFHSQNRTSRLFHGIRQHLKDTKARNKLVQTEAATRQQQALSPSAPKGQFELPLNLSKGICVYSYICAPGYSVQFSVPGKNGIITNTSDDNSTVKNLQVDADNIPLLGGFTGRFQWKVLKEGIEKASGYNDINAVTGNVEGGTMTSTQECLPQTTEDATVTCLFYDAGHGEAGLPNQSQCEITVTPTTNKTWMSTLAPPSSPAASRPFSAFVLPAPHDCGMNSMTSCNAVLHSADSSQISTYLIAIPNLSPFKNFAPSALLSLLPDIVYALAITQTAPLASMLAMGARYFEFRPAALYPLFKKESGLRDTCYYTHLNLPGLAFDEFLSEVVQFLDANENEIVVLHIRWDGVVSECARPSTAEINAFLTTACGKASSPLTWTDRSGLSQSIAALRQTHARIILLINAAQYSSYSDDANATLTPGPIVRAFNGMTTQGQSSSDLTLLQCQATATNIKAVVAYSVLSSNASNSPLSATKAVCDLATLPWCRENVVRKLTAERLVVIMNDFFDGGTAQTAIRLSEERLGGS